jgi:hypothetical protein
MPTDALHDRDRKRIAKLLGYKAEIHHHSTGEIVVCEDRAYHMLLHQRTDALRACGHVDWKKCTYCEKYDSPSNLVIRKNGEICHKKCKNEYNQIYRLRQKLKKLSILRKEVTSNENNP